jgi:hypothetical protein
MEEQYNDQQMIQPSFTPESNISNIVGQIDPAMIVDNLNHSLKGEFYDKERGLWVMNPSGVPLVNDACRGFIISYTTGILNNNSTMGIITQQQLGFLMESVIEDLGKEFVCNLERFGFVPEGDGFKEGLYENKGNPDSSRMSSVSNMIIRAIFSCYTRSINGMESKKMWSSLNLSDNLNFQPQQQQSPGWMGKILGK